MRIRKRHIALLISILFLVGFSFYAYKSENEKYEVVNEIIKDNNFYFDKICSKSIKIDVSIDNIPEFSLIDKLAINVQNLTQSTYEFKPNKLQYFDSRANKTKYTKIAPDCSIENDFLYEISMPVLSLDKKTAIIKIVENCNCLLGGQGGTYLYKKINGKWKRIKSFNNWIS